jgi:hypothetical protein
VGNQGLRGFSYVDTPVGVPFPDEAAMTTPKVTTFPTWRSGNGGTAVIGDLASGLGVRMTAYVPNGNSWSMTYAAVPVEVGSGGWQVTARTRGHAGPNWWGHRGIIMRDAVSGKSLLYGFDNPIVGGWYGGFVRYEWPDDETNGPSIPIMRWYEQDVWIRVEDDLTDWHLYISPNGNFWEQIYQETRNEYLGTTPTHVGIYMIPNCVASGWPVGTALAFDCYSWLFEML